MQDLPNLRIRYNKGSLDESEMAPDPIAQFSRWLDDAIAANVPEPNAMTLATVSQANLPSARVMLLKGVDDRGFVFFTNFGSRKGKELLAHPRAALVFFWHLMERQVRVEGTVERVSRQESEQYFHSRPRESQIGAWASRQSDVVASRAELDRRFEQMQQKFAGAQVPLPDFWGGFRVNPDRVEFWQGRPGRLHDRLAYVRSDAGGWTLQRLEP